ncbi:MAG TPA: hypothetical protein DEQ61_16710 [Streptomyces sp.]|nr:hypothetical protein [Streptomyces sp.]
MQGDSHDAAARYPRGMADTYRGAAVVLVDGAEHSAEVDLSIHVERNGNGGVTLKSWGGHLESSPAIDWFDSPPAGEAVIRMPDGREGRFLATAGAIGSGRVEIQGSGPAPFGNA